MRKDNIKSINIIYIQYARKFFENIEYRNWILDKARKCTTNFLSMQREVRYTLKKRTLYSGVEFPLRIQQFFINVVRC